ncbi:unnamed protein product [Periconia digitata]|uniref:Uncharacterized protein n=1 Tax=Periconia digitata TaxID=1303443 RepID=A0A9W4XRL8_9PLEO|nr:unnamed protein product [Periconia digitata]
MQSSRLHSCSAVAQLSAHPYCRFLKNAIVIPIIKLALGLIGRFIDHALVRGCPHLNLLLQSSSKAMAKTRAATSRRTRKMARREQSSSPTRPDNRDITPAIEFGPQNTPAHTPAPEAARDRESSLGLTARLQGIYHDHEENPSEPQPSDLPTINENSPTKTTSLSVIVVETGNHEASNQTPRGNHESADPAPESGGPTTNEQPGGEWTEVTLGNDISILEPPTRAGKPRKYKRRNMQPSKSNAPGSSAEHAAGIGIQHRPLKQYEHQLEQLQLGYVTAPDQSQQPPTVTMLAGGRPSAASATTENMLPQPAAGSHAVFYHHHQQPAQCCDSSQTTMSHEATEAPPTAMGTGTSSRAPIAPGPSYKSVAVMPPGPRQTLAHKALKILQPVLHKDDKNIFRIIREFRYIGKMVWHDLQAHIGVDTNAVIGRYYNPRMAMLAVYMWANCQHLVAYTEISTELCLPPGCLNMWVNQYTSN